jgi:hypothetical protein
MNREINTRAETIAEDQGARLGAPEGHRIELYRCETDLSTNLPSISLSTRTARAAPSHDREMIRMRMAS